VCTGSGGAHGSKHAIPFGDDGKFQLPCRFGIDTGELRTSWRRCKAHKWRCNRPGSVWGKARSPKARRAVGLRPVIPQTAGGLPQNAGASRTQVAAANS
jgi:hypothetical protein